MPTSSLPHNVQTWARIYANLGAKDLEIAKFESGSNFKYESAILLRVLHTSIRNVVRSCSSGIETLWIRDLELFPIARQTEARKAIRGPHFEGLHQVLERLSADRTGAAWSANDFAQAGCFGPFLCLLALIERDNTDEETGESAVTYCDLSPSPASRTRSQQARQYAFETPTKISYSVNEAFDRLGLEFTPDTSESLEEPPSGQGSAAKYAQAKVNVQDEQTVNQCLINLMLPITWHLGISGTIDPRRLAFTFLLDGFKAYEARVDGKSEARLAVPISLAS
ncbi:hypothetical protein BDZ45DRAFT_672413 [Acephala macrosclerotiorum]|nr:hypothetical protein BDZ45DRAFT_672413 [Acephala macrosclerotiorum]